MRGEARNVPERELVRRIIHGHFTTKPRTCDLEGIGVDAR